MAELGKSDYAAEPVGTGSANAPLDAAIKYKMAGPGGGVDQVAEELEAEGHGDIEEIKSRIAAYQEQLRNDRTATTSLQSSDPVVTDSAQTISRHTATNPQLASSLDAEQANAPYSVGEIPPPLATPGQGRQEELGRA